jgi:hypothetical protein
MYINDTWTCHTWFPGYKTIKLIDKMVTDLMYAKFVLVPLN